MKYSITLHTTAYQILFRCLSKGTLAVEHGYYWRFNEAFELHQTEFFVVWCTDTVTIQQRWKLRQQQCGKRCCIVGTRDAHKNGSNKSGAPSRLQYNTWCHLAFVTTDSQEQKYLQFCCNSCLRDILRVHQYHVLQPNSYAIVWYYLSTSFVFACVPCPANQLINRLCSTVHP